MRDIIRKIVYSWSNIKGINSIDNILDWVDEKNKNTQVLIDKISFDACNQWFYDDKTGKIVNKNSSFFSITGLKIKNDDKIVVSQPIIIQDEIGFLGIICKEINGTIHFLMQAKIEPGNLNKIQISPTIQATKSNFTQKHGGNRPAYLDYFINAANYKIIVDQIQSEQGARFLKKRNRNIIIYVDEDIEVLPSHKWMTLGQIKKLMKIDNLVNMDTRTVLSCIPYSLYGIKYAEVEQLFSDKELCRSIFNEDDENIVSTIYHYVNDFKMFSNFSTELVPLFSLSNWKMSDNEFSCLSNYHFKVVFCDISIEGREVKHWQQPLFEANGIAMFGLITRKNNGKREFLVHAKHEVGNLDLIELGPSVQLEANEIVKNNIEEMFCKLIDDKHVIHDVLLSEEGGRFYHEQNRNIIIEVAKEEITSMPEGYFWVDYRTLNLLQQVNNTLNIQLRNLLSLLEV